MDILDELNYVGSCLDEAKKWNLETEVILFALKAMKENNTLTIHEVLNIGMDEWIK